MNGSGKRVSAAVSFVGGIVLGALAMLALAPARPAPAGGSSAVVSPRHSAPVVTQAAAPAREAVADPGEDRKLAGHSELMLQLD